MDIFSDWSFIMKFLITMWVYVHVKDRVEDEKLAMVVVGIIIYLALFTELMPFVMIVAVFYFLFGSMMSPLGHFSSDLVFLYNAQSRGAMAEEQKKQAEEVAGPVGGPSPNAGSYTQQMARRAGM